MDINIPANINLEQYNSSLAECIKKVVNFHGVTYQNICDGTSQVVPWGSMMWVMIFFITLVFGFFVYMMLDIIIN